MLPIRSQSKDLLMKAPLLASMFTLAACGSGAQVEAENASVAEVQAKIKDATGRARDAHPRSLGIDRPDREGRQSPACRPSSPSG
jgi:hypothetical protein